MRELTDAICTNSRIMIVDDEYEIRSTLTLILEEHGYCVDPFNIAGDALESLNHKNCDLVITDVKMPGFSGIELLEQIHKSSPDIPVILMTAYADMEMAIAAVKNGAFDFIVKPYKVQQLLESINKALIFRRLQLLDNNYRTQLERSIAEKTSELRAAHEKLLISEKMAMIGQIAAGVAHEINNPVGFISSNLETLGKYLERFRIINNIQEEIIKTECSLEACNNLAAARKQIKFDTVVDDFPALIDECRDGIERIKNIVKGLGTFSRNDDDIPAPVNINEVLETTLTIIHNQLKYVAEVTTDFNDLPLVNGFRNQLSQVFMNIIINAAHAITERGKIRISTRATARDVLVIVADNGHGIAKDRIQRIFDPFYTTKEVGKGTGLGLSISYNIIKKHNGEILVESEPGKGTTFTISVPIDCTEKE